MSKQQTAQRFVLKIHSSRLSKAKWNLTLPLSEARRNDEIISLGDSQMLRWIDELNNIKDADRIAKDIKAKIRALKREPNSLKNRREIRELYAQADGVQFKPDYLCLIIDKDKDYRRACKGFKINGIEYARLVGTNGGVKNKTIVFVSKRLAPALRARITNGRDESIPLVPAKLEAYRALTCSGSIPVSMPKGILVVNDCETKFVEDVIRLTDELGDEPVMEYLKGETVELDESDGYGIMLPSLADRWSAELKLDYRVSGVNTRFSWEKGMVFCFDFIDFAEKIAKSYMVKDAWGNEVDIRNCEIILTTSMLKLWNCYKSLDHYLECCRENHYAFGVAKVCPKELESERDLNYQFIQSYDLTTDKTNELIEPTVNYIKSVLSLDYAKALLFLKGTHLNDNNVDYIDDDFVKAMMIDKRVFDDPFVKHKIYQMIQKRINDAKIGVIKIHGNYSIVSGDPYSLCQSIFDMQVTGLLKSGEIYNKYWADKQVNDLVCFRAPMTWHGNIRHVKNTVNDDISYWYQHMKTCTVFNSWDTAAHALNGMDKDGDLVMLTDNNVLLNEHKRSPALLCVQRRATKKVVTEEDLIQSNIDSFGDDIGKITNRITAMFDVRSQFPSDSKEYRVLDYRIKCGQLYQQNAIDKAKGIIAKPMPKEWYDRAANKFVDEDSPEDIERKEFNMTILADKKPYFMRYIYPTLMSQYNTYKKNTNKKCMREFRQTVDDLLAMPAEELTDAEREFVGYYIQRMPVGVHDCVMNDICRRVESEFDGWITKNSATTEFDYSILKSGTEYTASQYSAVAKLYNQYTKHIQEYMQFSKQERVDEDEASSQRSLMAAEFRSECEQVCSNSAQLCDIILDLCYRKSASRQFCWDICRTDIINNLLNINNNVIHYPVKDADGDIEFCGEKFTMKSKEIGQCLK